MASLDVQQEGVCPAPDVLFAEAAAPGLAAMDLGPLVLAANGLPILNSYPSAPTAIYIDFDGDTGQNITAYDVDGDPTTFNQAEQDTITEAWRQMSVYFSMFDTNVTTQTPTVPMVWNIIGNNTGGATGGYAYVDTFPNTSPNAFNNSSHARGRVTAMAHEVGHVFGLWHQSTYDLLGNKTAEYAGELDSLHGQLMGVDYAGQIHKWSIGHPAGSASDLQDDMDIIARKIKTYQKSPGPTDGYRKDDYGGTIAAASPLPLTINGQSANGIIERLADLDAFSFTSEGGSLRMAAVPVSPSGVDLKLAVYAADGTLLAAKDAATNDQQMTMTLAPGAYYAIVSSHGNYGDVGTYEISVHSLAAGWSSQDIGTTSQAGYAEFDSATGSFTVAGAGDNMEGTTDQGHFAYQSLSGDGEIVARVAGLQDTNAAAKAGLMIRESLTNNAKEVTMAATWANGPQLLWRSDTGDTAAEYHSTPSPFSFIWLKLVRKDSLFSGYTSIDGQDFTLFKTATVSMASKVYVGLVVCSYNSARLNTATFSDVSVSGGLGDDPPVYNGLAAPANLTAGPGTGTGLDLSWDLVAGATGYGVDRSVDGVSYTRIGTTAAADTTYSDTNLAGSMRYFYRVSALDATGASVPSNAASGVNRPSAATGLAITSLTTSSLVLNWKDTNGETGYRIERSTDGTIFSSRGTVTKNIPSWTDTGLSTATTYYYRVIPTSSQGDGLATTVANGTTRLPAVAGLAFDSVAYNRIVFHWTDLGVETGYRVERSLDGTTFTTLGTVTADTTTYTDAGVQQLKEYYYRVVGLKSNTESVLPTPIFTATPASVALRSPWATRDIGTVNGGGATGYTSSTGTFTVISGGNDIWDRNDSFRFTYQPLIGDGEIVARIATLEDTSGWAKVGVMIRESLNANSKHAMVVLTPGNGAVMQYRQSTGGSSTNVTGQTVAAPYYVKLVRTGVGFTGWISATGNANDWTKIGNTVNVSMSLTLTTYIGLAATSQSTTELNSSTIDKVTVANKAPTVLTAANVADNPVITTSTVLSVLGKDDHGESNLTYDWQATSIPAGALGPEVSVNGSNEAKTTTATFHQAGSYMFLATITDSSGQLVTSSVTVTVSQTLTTVSVVPGTVDLEHNTTRLFSAIIADQFGNPMAGNPVATWSIVSGEGQISANGYFTAPSSSATTIVRAAYAAMSGTATARTVISVPAIPTHIRGSLVGGALQLQWRDNATNEDGYRLERSVGPQSAIIAVLPAGSSSYTDPGPVEGIAIYTVWAVTSETANFGPSVVLMNGGNGNDSMSVRVDANDLLFTQDPGLLMGTSIAQTSQIIVHGGGGNDSLRVDFRGGDRIGAGVLSFDGAAGDDTLEIAGMRNTDSLTIDATQVALGQSTIAYSDAAVRLNVLNPGAIEVGALTLSGSAAVALLGGGATPLRVNTLNLAQTAALDLADNDLAVKTPDAASLLGLVKLGRTNGSWTGLGLTSSAARADTRRMTGLAVASNDIKGNGLLIDPAAGPSAVVVKYTWQGDANLDGVVNADDYFLIDAGIIRQMAGYHSGDFNYDSVINADDYFLIDSAFIGQRGPLAAGAGLTAASSGGSLVAVFASTTISPHLVDRLGLASDQNILQATR